VSNMAMYLSEFLGTFILVLLGDGVCANVSLRKSKGESGGWIVVTAGWGFAVAVAAYTVGWVGGAQINPAVTLGLAAIGKFSWALVPGYIIAQMLGAILGAITVYITYKDHFDATDDPATKLGLFATAPAVRNYTMNFVTEAIGTAILVVGLLGITNSHNNMGALANLMCGFLVWSIGLSLGGPTGYAINPARDLGPRIAHAILPIKGKGGSDWEYSWVPVFGPIVGGIIGALIYNLFFFTLFV
jgi:glycerol uptake facilitator protein